MREIAYLSWGLGAAALVVGTYNSLKQNEILAQTTEQVSSRVAERRSCVAALTNMEVTARSGAVLIGQSTTDSSGRVHFDIGLEELGAMDSFPLQLSVGNAPRENFEVDLSAPAHRVFLAKLDEFRRELEALRRQIGRRGVDSVQDEPDIPYPRPAPDTGDRARLDAPNQLGDWLRRIGLDKEWLRRAALEEIRNRHCAKIVGTLGKWGVALTGPNVTGRIVENIVNRYATRTGLRLIGKELAVSALTLMFADVIRSLDDAINTLIDKGADSICNRLGEFVERW